MGKRFCRSEFLKIRICLTEKEYLLGMYIKKRIPDGYVFLRLFACKNALRFIHASKLEINIRQVFSFHLHIDKYFVFKFDIIVFNWLGLSLPPLGLERSDYQEQTQKLIEFAVFWSKELYFSFL